MGLGEAISMFETPEHWTIKAKERQWILEAQYGVTD